MNAPNCSAILVIEPDPSIRALIVALLRRDGYPADAAGDPEEALRLHRSAPHAAVVVDPRFLGGDSLLQALQPDENVDAPARNVIVVTTADAAKDTYAERPVVRTVLFKPFHLDELVAAVAECCGGQK